VTIGIKPLYHFTDTRNLESIKQHGLLSLAELKRRGIVNQVVTGGEALSHQLDAELKLDEYVHLCFFNDHPMEYRAREAGRIQSTKFLAINPVVLNNELVKFTLAISNSTGVELLSFEQAKAQGMDIEIICPSTYQDWKDPDIKERRKIAKKYEILIPNAISIEFIDGL
jgi:hypothetical protein